MRPGVRHLTVVATSSLEVTSLNRTAIMRSITRHLVTGGIIAAGAFGRPAWADITHIQDGRTCSGTARGCEGRGPIPIEQGEQLTLRVKGQNVNFCEQATGDAVVTVTIVGTKLIADGFSVGTGQIDLRVAVANNAGAGNHTITLSNCVRETFTFTVGVLRNGSATAIANVPRQNAYFTQVDLTITGTNIANAGARLVGTTQSPTGSTQVSIVSSNATSATVRLTFSTGQSKATGQVVLFDNQFPGACLGSQSFGCYGPGLAYTVLGPNAIESISFPTGSAIRSGSVLTIRIRLTQPAPSGSFNPETGGSLSGELVKWQVHPSSSFVGETGTTFDSAATLNQIRFSAGSQQADVVVRLTQVPTSCGLSCTGTVEARVFDFRDASPYKQAATFTILTR